MLETISDKYSLKEVALLRLKYLEVSAPLIVVAEWCWSRDAFFLTTFFLRVNGLSIVTMGMEKSTYKQSLMGVLNAN